MMINLWSRKAQTECNITEVKEIITSEFKFFKLWHIIIVLSPYKYGIEELWKPGRIVAAADGLAYGLEQSTISIRNDDHYYIRRFLSSE